MPDDEKRLSDFLLDLTQSIVQSQAAYYDALSQLSLENRRIIEENDLAAARDVIREETGGSAVYFWILRWII
jgi:hypothetical protein